VAGIAASSNSNIGVAHKAELYGLQVFTIIGQINGKNDLRIKNPRHLIKALNWVLENHDKHKIRVVNMSLGGGFYTSPEAPLSEYWQRETHKVIEALEEANVTVVASAGNSYGLSGNLGNDTPNFQANAVAPGVFSTIVVGNVWEDYNSLDPSCGGGRFHGIVYWQCDDWRTKDHIVHQSNRPNPIQDGYNIVFAPGGSITSTIPNNKYGDKNGTSMASPMVAGVVALMQDAAMEFGGRYLQPNQIRDILVLTGDLITDGDDEKTRWQNPDTGNWQDFNYTGNHYSRMNAHKAVLEVRRIMLNQDPNGTLTRAYAGPSLPPPTDDDTGERPVFIVAENIGVDGNSIAVGEKDVDLYRFSVTTAGLVSMETSAKPGATKHVDSYLRL